MANNNKPIWKDYPLHVSGGTYVIKEYVNGSWVTRKTFHALANPKGDADVCVNNMLCNDLKTSYPDTIGVTKHSEAWRRYMCATGATESATTEMFNFCQDWSWEDWDGEQRTLSCPINGHADMRQRLFRSRFGELSEDIEIKTLVHPNFSYYYLDNVAADYTSGFITVTANEDYSIDCSAAWITGLSGVTGTTGEQTFFFYIEPYTGFTDRSTTIEISYANYEGEVVTDELPLTQRAVIPFFNVYPVEQSIVWDATSAFVAVNTNMPFTVSDNQSWIEYSGKTQAGYNAWNVLFDVSANTSASRQAVITFTYPISATQSGTTTTVVRQTKAPTTLTYKAGSQVSLNNTVFGASVVSHTFSDGTGVISFSQAPTQISGDAFKQDTTLTYIDIPSSVLIIGDNVFSGCTRLTSIELPENLQSIGKAAFFQTRISYFDIPKSCLNIDISALTSQVAVTVSTHYDGTEGLTVYGGYRDGGTFRRTFPSTWGAVVEIEDMSIFPDGFWIQGSNAYTRSAIHVKNPPLVPDNTIYYMMTKNYDGRTPLQLPQKVLKYGWTSASQGLLTFSGLETITALTQFLCIDTTSACFDNMVRELAVMAFPNNLKTIDLSFDTIGSSENVYISELLFGSELEECKLKLDYAAILSTLDFSQTKLGSLYVNAPYVNILKLPNTITYIDHYSGTVYAFSHLYDIYYDGTKAEWDLITKTNKWKQNSCTLHCTDGNYTI